MRFPFRKGNGLAMTTSVRYRLGWGFVGVLIFTALSACAEADSGSANPEIRIGVLSVLGDLAPVAGLPTERGALMAADEINAAGGLDLAGVPHRVVMVVGSHEDRADAAAGRARALINQEGVVALLGPQISRHAIPVSNVAEAARVPMISPMSSHPQTTAGKRYVFRLAFTDQAQGAALAEFAREDLGASRAAMLFDVSQPFSRDLAGFFAARFEAVGGQLVASEEYTSDAPLDYREHLARIRAQDPDVLFLPNPTTQDSVQVEQVRAMGFDVELLGGDMWDLGRMPGIAAADGAHTAQQWSPDLPTQEARDFIRRYSAAHGEQPRSAAAMTYDAARLLLRTIDEVDSVEADDIRRGLASVQEFVGATGTISFDGSGDPVRSVTISRITDGAVVLETVRTPGS